MGHYKIVAIGSSAGGIKAFEKILSGMPGDFPVPILIGHFIRSPIDLMLKSMAATCESSAIGVILPGSGRDGSAGIKAIKVKDGFTIAQDPATSEHFSMPPAAIDTDMADLVLPQQGITQAVIDLVTKSGG